ncbi:MAG: SurA N-terminal domain-containing protein [Verrucomicrobia bacterium]|nr:SurA N-terminal domain-containing protein [Verrucomicrobiota bacterium]
MILSDKRPAGKPVATGITSGKPSEWFGVMFSLASAMALHGATESTEVNRLVAAVNNRPITQSEVRNAAAMQVQVLVMQAGRSLPTPELEQKVKEIEKNALQDLIDRELILDSFKKMGATIRPQHVDDAVTRFIKERFGGDHKKFVQELKNSGMTLQQFRQMQEESIIVQAMRAKNADSVPVFATPAEIETFWKENRVLFASPGAVKLRTITVPKLVNGDVSTALSQKSLVEEIHGKLRGGADFGAMARAYSVDSGAEDNGVRGTFKKEELQASLADAAFSVPVQTVSNVIDLGDFYTVIFVDARDDGEVAPLSDPKIEEEVRRRVLQNKRQESVERWLTRLRRDANIRTFE